ncbi:MAG: M23 family metallopeptidase [Clostridiaceae bacterium]|nr:M23 family metallopeptidase [Clostridiaceae bacterium]
MSQDNRNFSQLKKKKNKFIGIILLFGVVILCCLLIWFTGKRINNDRNDNVQLPETPSSSASQSNTPVPVPVSIPKATLEVDGIDYVLSGLRVGEVVPVSSDDTLKAGIGKGSVAHLSFEVQPDSYNVTLFKDNETVFSGKTSVIFSDEIPDDGEYHGVCEAQWSQGEFIGSANYYFTISADFPALPAISSTETNPGELIVLRIKYLNPQETVEIETDLDFKPNLFEYNQEHVILLPVSYLNKYDKVYSFKLLIGEETFSYAIKVNDKEFVTQQLTIDTKIAAETRNDKSAKEVKEKIDPLRPVCDDEAYWEGDFIMPVEGGRVREYDFGKRRHVNGAPTSYRHNGLDIGHDLGVPVMASNTGRILIADYMIGTGNTVIIEHGFGLKTWYYHMDELNVKTGDMVKKGDIIGKVGTTGFSTGPHLHFSSSINWVYVNPITLINEGIPLITTE